jgi:Alternative oxidase
MAKGKKEVTAETAPKATQMTEKDWMLRIIFLETVAGVPGMVGGMIRHLRSLRKMEKEGRWIETLLEEAENERMHLMTFMAIKKPGPFMRLMIVGAQGVFCNAFFFSYLMYLHIKFSLLTIVLLALVIDLLDTWKKRQSSHIHVVSQI